MLPAVKMLDEMDDQMWSLLQRNLGGITEAEADWRPHAAANNMRWVVGHLAWFEEWAHDALREEGRYFIARDPTAFLEGTMPDLLTRFGAARCSTTMRDAREARRWTPMRNAREARCSTKMRDAREARCNARVRCNGRRFAPAL